jgi:medium-chain acyl-[acyl-carrier-protein] hydrolase
MSAIGSLPTAWVVRLSPGSRKDLRLFCLPYAGGLATVYRPWAARLPPDVDLCAVELPGRGARLKESPVRDLTALVDAAVEGLRPALDRPFALFGHSMGALVAFELARRLGAQGLAPRHLFVSGHAAPHLPGVEPPMHPLPDHEFIERLRGLNGTPLEVLQHPELMEMMLPILRADFTACERYVPAPAPPLEVPISAFGGTDDPDVSQERLDAWRPYTSRRFIARRLPGDHFFLNNPASRDLLTRAVWQDLDRGTA